MELAIPAELERQREWKKLAEAFGIPIDEDPQLAAERHRRAMAIVEAEFGGDDVAF